MYVRSGQQFQTAFNTLAPVVSKDAATIDALSSISISNPSITRSDFGSFQQGPGGH
jgi:hypothetical protein